MENCYCGSCDAIPEVLCGSEPETVGGGVSTVVRLHWNSAMIPMNT